MTAETGQRLYFYCDSTNRFVHLRAGDLTSAKAQIEQNDPWNLLDRRAPTLWRDMRVWCAILAEGCPAWLDSETCGIVEYLHWAYERGYPQRFPCECGPESCFYGWIYLDYGDPPCDGCGWNRNGDGSLQGEEICCPYCGLPPCIDQVTEHTWDPYKDMEKGGSYCELCGSRCMFRHEHRDDGFQTETSWTLDPADWDTCSGCGSLILGVPAPPPRLPYDLNPPPPTYCGKCAGGV